MSLLEYVKDETEKKHYPVSYMIYPKACDIFLGHPK